jgi:hypothetical protein
LTEAIQWDGTVSRRMKIQKWLGRMENMDGDVSQPYFQVSRGVARVWVARSSAGKRWDVVREGEWIIRDPQDRIDSFKYGAEPDVWISRFPPTVLDDPA